MSDDVTRLAEVLRTSGADRSLAVGTLVLAWPGTRTERPYIARTRTPVWEIAGIPVVSIEGIAGGIALTHIEVLPDELDPAINRLLGATQAKSDAIDAHAELVTRMEALCGPCENYATPGQDCITAGPEVFAAEACTSCVIRAALNDPTEETTP